jgi:hypothetical protein
MRIVEGGGHGTSTWYPFYAADVSMYAWLLQHDNPVMKMHDEQATATTTTTIAAQDHNLKVEGSSWFRSDPISRPRTCGVRPDVVFPCLPQDATEKWSSEVVSKGRQPNPHPVQAATHRVSTPQLALGGGGGGGGYKHQI